MVKASPRRREDGSRYAAPQLTHEEIKNFDGCNQSGANYQRNNFLIWEEPGPSLKEELLKELNLQFLCPPMLDELIRSHQPREVHEVTEEYVELKGEKGIFFSHSLHNCNNLRNQLKNYKYKLKCADM